MALDVQPLSRGRRWAMVAFLGLLFAGSLGFAQWLTIRAQREQGTRKIEPPKNAPAPQEEDV